MNKVLVILALSLGIFSTMAARKVMQYTYQQSVK